MKTPLALTVNGKLVKADVELRRLLVEFLREHLRLTGTHVGCCDTSQCGAFSVLVNRRVIKSCTALAVCCERANVTTIEALAPRVSSIQFRKLSARTTRFRARVARQV